MDSSFNSPTTRTIYRGTQIVWYVIGIIEILLAFRFIFKLFGANPSASFSTFIYGVSSVFTAPFSAVFRTARIEGNVFEWTTLLAMVVYWIIGIGIIRLFIMGKTVSIPEAAAKIEEKEG